MFCLRISVNSKLVVDLVPQQIEESTGNKPAQNVDSVVRADIHRGKADEHNEGKQRKEQSLTA